MSDEPYAFGPTDPHSSPVPSGRPDAQPGPETRAWGSVPDAQPPGEGRKRMSTMAKSLTAVGVAAVIAVGGTVAVTSANADNTSSAPSSPKSIGSAEDAGGMGRSGGFGGGMASRSLIAGALHGEFVVADGTGTVTERLQTGSISSISATSLTVESTDDFTATYAIAAGTDVSALATGTTVTVVAEVDGSTVTLVSVTAASQGGAGRGTSGGGTGGFAPGGTSPSGSSPDGTTGTAGATGEDSGV